MIKKSLIAAGTMATAFLAVANLTFAQTLPSSSPSASPTASPSSRATTPIPSAAPSTGLGGY